jgi:hypothetical protein
MSLPAVVKPLRAAVDWEAIETLYRCGVLSIREIAKTHGLSDGAVRKRAKRDGWDRDLAAKVNTKVRSELVVRSEVRSTQDAVSERTMVEAAATADWESIVPRRAPVQSGNRPVARDQSHSDSEASQGGWVAA